MIFELGKMYIVDVSEKGVVPVEEFDRDRWYDKDSDDLDFLTDEEKIVVIKDVLDKIRARIEQLETYDRYTGESYLACEFREDVLHIIDKYKAESEDK